MPRSSNSQGDLSNLSNTNPVADKDNVYFSDRGWVYRHYKNAAKTEFWDEVLVAGQALQADGTADGSADDFGDPTSFLTGDGSSSPVAGGAVLVATLTTAGEGYTTETSATQASTSGTGVGLTGDITVDGDGVATFVVTDPGSGYVDGEVVTLDGGTVGATVTVIAA